MHTKDGETPERFGHFRVTDVLGEGAMGLVFGAVDERLDRPVAVKVLRQQYAADPVARERFWREARLAARVNHPHICQLYDVGEEEGRFFLAMERLVGETLAARLARGALSVADAVPIGLQVLTALEVLHQHGIVHRDLKPSNVFLTSYGVKILDFGVSRIDVDATTLTGPVLTQADAMIGTPRYMAPEQLLGQGVEPPTDLFAVGAILYEMVAGAPAFGRDTIAGVVDEILHGDVSTLAGSCAIAALDRVIHRSMAKAASHRYPNAAAMAADLATVLSADGPEQDRPARPVTRVMVLPFRLPRPDPDIDFLAFSLADAVANALSSFDTLVISSPLIGRRYATDVPDLARIADEAKVDMVLAGTLLRSNNVVRLTAQLVETSSGQIRWSHNDRVAFDDLLQIEEALIPQIVQSLMVPLGGRHDVGRRTDVPANAKAYEFYLRANPLSHDSRSWEIARDLYRQAVDADPQYAPAWARLGRVHRLLAKFRPAHGGKWDDSGEQDALSAESAFNRALMLNPDLTIADSYYAQLELDLGRAQEAMTRLIRRAAIRSTDPELFAALVSACRYCGLFSASFAAHERACRLDPNARTSVTHTYFMAGEYLKAADESERHWQPGNLGGIALLCAGHPDARARMAIESQRYGGDETTDAFLAGDYARSRAAADRVLATFPDPEFHFYSALLFAHSNYDDRATEVLAGAVQRGFFPLDTLERHAWLDRLRAREDFHAVVREARRRHENARIAFVDAGGSRLLGIDERL